jgi:hypothetical protein
MALHVDHCHPNNQFLSSCENLFDISAHRYTILLQSVLSIIANLAAGCTYVMKHDIDYVILLHMAIADGCMGLYLGVVSGADLTYKGIFYTLNWTHNHLCIIAGILHFLISEMSLLLLVFLSFQWSKVINTMAKVQRMDGKLNIVAIIYWFLVLLTGIILVTFVYTELTSIHNNQCLLFVVREGIVLNKLELSIIIIFILLNSALLVSLVTIYSMIFIMFKKSKAKVSSSTSKGSFPKVLKLFLNLVVIVVTNFALWVPVLIISILSISGYKLHDYVLSMLVVLVIPINASTNPLMFAFKRYWFESIKSALSEKKGRKSDG